MRTKIFFTAVIAALFTVITSGNNPAVADLENELYVEAWMSTPFLVEEAAEAAVLEADAGVEQWMVVPFETGSAEEELVIETWMTVPFEVPVQEEDVLECWMVTPFEVFTVSASL